MPIINCFFIYSVLGFFFEATYNLITSNHFSSGIMYGPWTPIYGIGAILTIQIHKSIFEKSNQNKFVKNLMFFYNHNYNSNHPRMVRWNISRKYIS